MTLSLFKWMTCHLLQQTMVIFSGWKIGFQGIWIQNPKFQLIFTYKH